MALTAVPGGMGGFLIRWQTPMVRSVVAPACFACEACAITTGAYCGGISGISMTILPRSRDPVLNSNRAVSGRLLTAHDQQVALGDVAASAVPRIVVVSYFSGSAP